MTEKLELSICFLPKATKAEKHFQFSQIFH